jgi:hypothetical protein
MYTKSYEIWNVYQMLRKWKCTTIVTKVEMYTKCYEFEMYIKCYEGWNVHQMLQRLKYTFYVTKVEKYIKCYKCTSIYTKCYKLTVIFKCISNESKPKYYPVVSVSALTMFIQIWMDLGVF